MAVYCDITNSSDKMLNVNCVDSSFPEWVRKVPPGVTIRMNVHLGLNITYTEDMTLTDEQEHTLKYIMVSGDKK